jgi:hypothetical protein
VVAPGGRPTSTEVFDEGVDINTVLALIDATILVVMGFVLASLRRAQTRS